MYHDMWIVQTHETSSVKCHRKTQTIFFVYIRIQDLIILLML